MKNSINSGSASPQKRNPKWIVAALLTQAIAVAMS